MPYMTYILVYCFHNHEGLTLQVCGQCFFALLRIHTVALETVQSTGQIKAN